LCGCLYLLKVGTSEGQELCHLYLADSRYSENSEFEGILFPEL
jgi:hypothetical protein